MAGICDAETLSKSTGLAYEQSNEVGGYDTLLRLLCCGMLLFVIYPALGKVSWQYALDS